MPFPIKRAAVIATSDFTCFFILIIVYNAYALDTCAHYFYSTKIVKTFHSESVFLPLFNLFYIF